MKSQALFLVRPLESKELTQSKGFDFLMECIFYKNPRLIGVARAIFNETVRRGYYDADRWRSLLKEHGVGQGGYYAVVSRLVGLGLIKRKKRRYYLSKDFSLFLESSARVWNEKVRSWKLRSLFDIL